MALLGMNWRNGQQSTLCSDSSLNPWCLAGGSSSPRTMAETFETETSAINPETLCTRLLIRELAQLRPA